MKLNLRDFFWLAAVVGLAIGWWIDHRALTPAAAKYANLVQQTSKIHNALHVEGVAFDADAKSGRVAVYEVPRRLKDLKYEAKIAKQQLELLETRLTREGRKVEWIWANGEVSLRLDK